MSNPPHNPVSPSDSCSDDRPLSDIPPARRQPADIPLHEIEQASVSPPKPRKRSRRLILGCLLVGAAGAGLWQWNRLDPEAPFLVGVKQTWAIAIAKTGLSEQTASSPNAAPNAGSNIERAVANASEPSTAASTEALATIEPSGIAGETTGSPSEILTQTSAPAHDQTNSQINGQTNSQTNGQTNSQTNGQTNGLNNNQGSSDSTKNDTLLNHRRYEEAPAEELVKLNPNSLLKLQPAAQQAVEAMLAKARAEGVQLGVISAFRTIEDQNHLYFQIKAERGQSAETRAKVSAPPGYSEHHTGYAVDFIDEGRPDTQLSQSFETTPAYQWLAKNAAFFNFEMSFPKDESSGVSYEPWHWRYVGDQKSLELFYKEQ